MTLQTFRLNVHINIRSKQKEQGGDLMMYNKALAKTRRAQAEHEKIAPYFEGSFSDFKKSLGI